jgi:hypothetical protein
MCLTLWKTRENALAHPEVEPIHRTLETGFVLIDEGLKLLEQHLDDSDLARLAGVFLLKGKNLALGCYSLSLDGLAQESGALLRPLLEALEKAQYLRTVPGAIERVQNSDFPEAGDIAKAVGGSFRELKRYLSDNASHARLEFYALRHLIRFKEELIPEFVTMQPFRIEVVRQNLIITGVFVHHLLTEAMLCIQEVYGGCPGDLIDRADLFRRHILLHKELDE